MTPTPSLPRLSDDELLALAGKPAFARGRAYAQDGRVALSRHDDDGLEGEAKGSDTYLLWLKRDGEDWSWDCTCPAADGGAFCKHLVATVLTAREESGDGERESDGSDGPYGSEAPKRTPSRRGSKRSNDLGAFLRTQSRERLSGWLLAFAEQDATIDKQLHLYRAADDPDELKAALGKMLDAGGFLDYRRSLAYARRLDAVIVQLDAAIARDAPTGLGLCDYVLKRLLKIYARSDDSAGAIGDQLHSIAERHARACAEVAPGKDFAKTLFALQQKDEWDLFPIRAYWNALGVPGQTDYGKRIMAEFATLPANESDETRWTSGSFGVARRTEEFARASGDFELLQRVLRRHLSRPHDHLRVLESLREFNRPREALAWAEQAVRRFPKDERLRGELADCLASAGLDVEATEQAWHAFRLSPVAANWDQLKRIAGTTWPAERARALESLAARDRDDASHRATLLLHDGDFEAAVALASDLPVRIDVLQTLARRLEHDRPAVAGEFYLRVARWQVKHMGPKDYATLAQTLKRAAHCLPTEQWSPVVAKVRAEHGRKLKLMGLLTQAGL